MHNDFAQRRTSEEVFQFLALLNPFGRKFLTHQFTFLEFLEPPIFLDLKMNLPATSLKPAFLNYQCLWTLSRTNVNVCVHVCVRALEKERERGGGGKTEPLGEVILYIQILKHVHGDGNTVYTNTQACT